MNFKQSSNFDKQKIENYEIRIFKKNVFNSTLNYYLKFWGSKKLYYENEGVFCESSVIEWSC
jgi:hypothetical protein